MEHFIIKTDNIKHYLLPNFSSLKFSYKKYGYILVQK